MAGYTVVTLNTGLYLNIRYLSFNIFHFHNSPDAYGMKPFRTVLWFGNKQIGHNKTVLRGDEDSLISIWFIAFLSPVIDYRLHLYQGQVGWGKSEPQFWSFWQSSISHSRVKSLLVSKFLSTWFLTRKSTLHFRAKFESSSKIHLETSLNIDQGKRNFWIVVEKHHLVLSTMIRTFEHPKSQFHSHFQKSEIHVDFYSASKVFNVWVSELMIKGLLL